MPTFNSSHPDFESLAARYEDFVSHSPYTSYMQSIHWAQVKNNWDADYVYVEDEQGNIRAAMSLVSISNDGGQSAFTYGPGAPVCDFADRALVEELIAEAEPALAARHTFLLRLGIFQVKTAQMEENWQGSDFVLRFDDEIKKTTTNPPCVMALDLDRLDDDDPMAFFHSSVRNKIRKGAKNGVSTRFVTVESPDYEDVLDKFVVLMDIMSERQHISHRPRDYYDRMLRVYPNARLWITEHESGLPLAGCLVLTYGQEASYVYAASSNDMRQTRPSFQMNYEAIIRAKNEGMVRYDMGGVLGQNPDEGLYKFKERFCTAAGFRDFIGEIDVVRDQEKYAKFIAR